MNTLFWVLATCRLVSRVHNPEHYPHRSSQLPTRLHIAKTHVINNLTAVKSQISHNHLKPRAAGEQRWAEIVGQEVILVSRGKVTRQEEKFYYNTLIYKTAVNNHFRFRKITKHFYAWIFGWLLWSCQPSSTYIRSIRM